ncbi:MAG: hypothetical protein EZS28_046953 [Streblomastix strix]|uniref:Uncharacterized protein n=1 Tax=Streblomastix strix TaxID=222440 RepID=A0A5J4TID1_9EUKA|nr:MAG: hypothetical protein EZS28_046953 [Streblomastix strix]
MKAGTYEESEIKVISERITMKGEDIGNITIQNKDSSCILSIETDNIFFISGGGLRLERCQFINISNASVIKADISDTFSDLIFRDCKFNQFINTLEGSIVVTNSMVNDPIISKMDGTIQMENKIKSYSFGGCTGNASSESISIIRRLKVDNHYLHYKLDKEPGKKMD